MRRNAIFDGDPTKVDHGVATGVVNVTNIMASKYIGDYQPSQALKCLMQQPPPPSTVDTRRKYMSHVIKYKDSYGVKLINFIIGARWREADQYQRAAMIEDFRAAVSDPANPNTQLHNLFSKWVKAELRRANSLTRFQTGDMQATPAQAHAAAAILGNEEPPPELAVPDAYRPVPQRPGLLEEVTKDVGFWEKLIREQPRRSSGGPTGWRFSL